MFMDLFNVDKLLNDEKEEEDTKKGQYDTSQYDAAKDKAVKLNANDAAYLIVRTDDNVDFQTAWSVLREMISSDDYREEVLRLINSRTIKD
jgi:hypothetical protein